MKEITIYEPNIQNAYTVLLEHCHQVRQHSELVSSGKWERSTNFCFWEWDQVELLNKKVFISGDEVLKKQSSLLAKAFGMIEVDDETEAHIRFYHNASPENT